MVWPLACCGGAGRGLAEGGGLANGAVRLRPHHPLYTPQKNVLYMGVYIRAVHGGLVGAKRVFAKSVRISASVKSHLTLMDTMV